MTTVTLFDAYLDRINRHERLSADDINDLAASPDILSLGMLADTVRRRMHDTRVTFLRVAELRIADPIPRALPAAAREVRLSGASPDFRATLEVIASLRTLASGRRLAACTWSDVERWASDAALASVLTQLREAGLDSLAELSLDEIADPALAIRALYDAGFRQLRATVSKAPAETRATLFLRASELQQEFGCIQSINPLPLMLSTFRPTTGYEDVKMVAIARLAAPNISSIQVDWHRYGPKLSQVALTFGADDVDGISASDDAPEGRRRAPRAEILRNIEAAGLVAVERDGRFLLV